MTAVARFDRRCGAASRVPDGAGDGVAARPHLVVNLHRGQFPADAVVGAAHREARLGQRALVGGHAGGRLCKKNKNKTLQSCDTEPVQTPHRPKVAIMPARTSVCCFCQQVISQTGS